MGSFNILALTGITLLCVSNIIAQQQFKNCTIDLGIIIDESSSLGRQGFREEKNFVKEFTHTFAIGDKGIYVSILKFATKTSMELYFKDPAAKSRALLDGAIDAIQIKGGSTNTHLALELARSSMFTKENGKRDHVSKVLLILTDGQSQSGLKVLSAAADALKNEETNILAIGIGGTTNMDELKGMASEPIANHVFTVSGTKELLSIIAKVREEACREIKCPFKKCVHSEWSKWSGECEKAERFKTLVSQSSQSVTRTAGCAGLSNTCQGEIKESKVLPNKCSQNCTINACKWADFSTWTKSCGDATRKASLVRSVIYKQSPDCGNLQAQLGCKETQEEKVETRKIKCKCPGVSCALTQWGDWSAKCGPATRARHWAPNPVVIEAYDCSTVKTTCSPAVEIDHRVVPCEEAQQSTDGSQTNGCEVPFEKLGCYKDDQKVPRPIPELILNERITGSLNPAGILIDWNNWDTYYKEFVCRCAKAAKSKGYFVFSAQFYGECWSGPDSSVAHARNGVSEECISAEFKPCKESDKMCIGKSDTNFAYRRGG